MLRRSVLLSATRIVAFFLPAFPAMLCAQPGTPDGMRPRDPLALRALPDIRSEVMENLARSGLGAEAILGYDASGLPIVCGTTDGTVPPGFPVHLSYPKGRPRGEGVAVDPLPIGRRGWEAVPCVIRTDGIESFRVEVDVNGPAQQVTMSGFSPYLIPPGPSPIALRDDGLGGDRVAGDFVYTSGPFKYKKTVPLPSYYMNDVNSPAGAFAVQIGDVQVREADSLWTFVQQPAVGFLRSGIYSEDPVIPLSPDLAVSGHLVNVRSSSRGAQNFIRGLGFGPELQQVTQTIYSRLPDLFDFLVFLSTNKVEAYQRSSLGNSIAGVHQTVHMNYLGTGQPTIDMTADYGSAGRLLGVNVLDPPDRGLYSNFATHEIMHQWASYVSPLLGIRIGAHYKLTSSVASLLGGYRWTYTGDELYEQDCTQGWNNASQASPLDLYLMGVIDASAVPPFHVSNQAFNCYVPIFDYTTVTSDQLEIFQGPRFPGPTAAPRFYQVGFVVESNGRLLNETEMTFYEMFARHYATVLDPSKPNPYLASNWAPASRFFGNDVHLETEIQHGLVSAPDRPEGGQARLTLEPNVPNPFHSGTTLRWSVPATLGRERTVLQVVDVSGRVVRTLLDQVVEPGPRSLVWDGRDDRGARARPGIYLCRLRAGSSVLSRMVTLL